MGYRLKAPLKVYRIGDRRRPIFDGYGAFLKGGRWSPPGFRVVYGSLSLACAMLEVLAWVQIGKFPKNQVWTEILLPKGILIEEVLGRDVPGWDDDDNVASQGCGEDWLKTNRSAVLVVPSKVTQQDKNILIRLDHPEAAKIHHTTPQPVPWDNRIRRRFGGRAKKKR